MSFSLVGRVWDGASFADYLRTVDLSWARGITMHHTASPSLRQRPNGLKAQHIQNIQSYYQGTLGWSRGPHLFIDDDQIFGMSPLDERGVHAVSFNRSHIGIEVLGDYDSEDPYSGRGLACWNMATRAAAAILERTGWGVDSINGHRDDPRTSKSCPWKKVDLKDFRAGVQELMHAHEQDQPMPRDSDRGGPDPIAMQSIEAIEWQLAKLKDRLG